MSRANDANKTQRPDVSTEEALQEEILVASAETSEKINSKDDDDGCHCCCQKNGPPLINGTPQAAGPNQIQGDISNDDLDLTRIVAEKEALGSTIDIPVDSSKRSLDFLPPSPGPGVARLNNLDGRRHKKANKRNAPGSSSIRPILTNFDPEPEAQTRQDNQGKITNVFLNFITVFGLHKSRPAVFWQANMQPQDLLQGGVIQIQT